MATVNEGPPQRAAGPLLEACPLCEFEGPRLAVYRHLDSDHPEVDAEDFFSDPIGE